MTELLHELVFHQATASPNKVALVSRDDRLTYEQLAQRVRAFAHGILEHGIEPGERVGVFLDKRFETVIAKFGAAAAGASFVPINPMYQSRHVSHVLRNCDVRILVTSIARLRRLEGTLADCPDLRLLVLVDPPGPQLESTLEKLATRIGHCPWAELLGRGRASTVPPHRRNDDDMVAIFYTSGSTGMPKGVVLTHRNIVTGARSVSQYLENSADDSLLAALPLSFDAGFSQLSTGFVAGASVVLINYLLSRDIINAISKYRITGLTGVPPLFIQLAQELWPEASCQSLRYIASTGGRMPQAVINQLRARLPETKIFLMYGLTEAFRSTYLPPSELDARPDSIGKAIPNAEILVVRPDGELCGPEEEGELVHRGDLVAKGYWNDPEATAQRFRPLSKRHSGECLAEIAVWSGDTVRMDSEGFLYFVGRRDDMIKTSGYRVSPTEVEEVIHMMDEIGQTAVIGVPHPTLGEAIVAIVVERSGMNLDEGTIIKNCRNQLPSYMIPQLVLTRDKLPLTENGKIDRKLLRHDIKNIFETS
jgi:acyl-CoA ligase (AMP-forming) (exosortase A-associated)